MLFLHLLIYMLWIQFTHFYSISLFDSLWFKSSLFSAVEQLKKNNKM